MTQQSKKTTPRILGALCIALALFFLCVCIHNYAEAQRIKETVLDTLEAMGITDARPSTAQEAIRAEDSAITYLCYTSDSAGLVFNFDGTDGHLRSVDTFASLQPDDPNGVTINAIPLTDAQREAESIAMAQMLLIPNQIGELRLEKIRSNHHWDRFDIYEYYEGQPTGTSVTVAWEGSTIMGAIPHFGKIFTKDADGNIIPAHDGEKIPEAQAIETALKALRELGKNLDEETATCELVIVAGDYCYEVFVQGVPATPDGLTSSCTALIDAYSGEVLELSQSA